MPYFSTVYPLHPCRAFLETLICPASSVTAWGDFVTAAMHDSHACEALIPISPHVWFTIRHGRPHAVDSKCGVSGPGFGVHQR